MDQTTAPDVNAKSARPDIVVQVAGHFGELVQGRHGRDGPLALVTLPCPTLVTSVRFRPGTAPLRVLGTETTHVTSAARHLLAQGPRGGSANAIGGEISITRPVPPGYGAGSSTAEILGTIRALATAQGCILSPAEEAALCHRTEGAVDPLMMPGTVLFASREGRVLRPLPALPPLRVVGGFAGPGHRTDPADLAFPDMTEAFALLERALTVGALSDLAAAARLSAEANQVRNPNPLWHAVCREAGRFGSLGPVVSHTGSAIGLLFPPEVEIAPVRAWMADLGLRHVTDFAPQHT